MVVGKERDKEPRMVNILRAVAVLFNVLNKCEACRVGWTNSDLPNTLNSMVRGH